MQFWLQIPLVCTCIYIYKKYVPLSICIRMRDLMADQSGIQIWTLSTPAYKFNRMRDIMMDHAHWAVNMCPPEWSDSLVKCSTNLSDASNQTCLTVIFLALNDKWQHYLCHENVNMLNAVLVWYQHYMQLWRKGEWIN